MSWINIDGLGDVELLRRLGEHFGLHPLALEDVLNTSHRPKIEEYHEHYLRDCYDHLIQIMDVIESYRDLTTGMMDPYLSSLGIRTNEIMRVLTVVTTIFIPLTFIAGVYGMNFSPEAGRFSMPELRQPYGYAACLTLMFAVALGMIFFFRKKRWL